MPVEKSATLAQSLKQITTDSAQNYPGTDSVQLVNFSMPNGSTIEPLDIFEREIIPAVADVGDPAPQEHRERIGTALIYLA